MSQPGDLRAALIPAPLCPSCREWPLLYCQWYYLRSVARPVPEYIRATPAAWVDHFLGLSCACGWKTMNAGHYFQEQRRLANAPAPATL